MTDIPIYNNSTHTEDKREKYKKTDVISVSSEDLIEIKDLIEVKYLLNTNNNYKWIEIIHCGCEGRIQIIQTEKYKIMFCPSCGFRSIFPKSIITTEQLIKYYDENSTELEEKTNNKFDYLDLRKEVMLKNKISIAQHNEKIKDVKDAKLELSITQAELAKTKKCEIMDNCQNCKGSGQVEDGCGDPAHNPYGKMLYIDCSECEGKGYE